MPEYKPVKNAVIKGMGLLVNAIEVKTNPAPDIDNADA